MTNHDSQIFTKEVIYRKYPNVKFKVIPQNDKWFISITYGRLGFFDSLNFMKKNHDAIVKPMNLDDPNNTKKLLGEKWEFFTKIHAYPYEIYKKNWKTVKNQ